MKIKDLEIDTQFIVIANDLMGIYVGCVADKAIVIINGATERLDCNTEVLRYVP